MRRDRLPLLLPVAAFLAILPLLLRGNSCGHDFDFHLLNWIEAAAQFQHGNFHPHWAVSPAYNAGEPRFVFYPPISWTLGALLGLLPTTLGAALHLPIPTAAIWTAAPIAFTWIALTLAGLTLYRLARTFVPPPAALLAATFYLVNPYMLFTAYERTAYAELLAAAWIPLLLHAILRPRVTIPRIALPVALLWLTNAPAAVMSCYALALLTLTRLVLTRVTHPSERSEAPQHLASPPHLSPIQSSISLALHTAAGTLLGLALAAFYLLPAATERRFIQIAMAIIPGLRIQDNFLFHHTAGIPDAAAHEAVLHTASLIAVLLLTLTTAALLTAILSHKPVAATPTHRPERSEGPQYSILPAPSPLPALHSPSRTTAIALAPLTLSIAFALTPLSAPFWNHLPELAFLQFPWRLLALLAPTLALATALALHRTLPNLRPVRAIFAALLLASAATAFSVPLFRQPCDELDSPAARLALFNSHQGTEPTDEYTPVTADNDVLSPHAPPFWLSPDPGSPAPPAPSPALEPTHLTVDSPIPQFLILNLRAYPEWRLTLNGQALPPQPDPNLRASSEADANTRDDGLLVLPIPRGPSTLDIAFVPLPIEHLANLLSALAALILLTLTLIPRITPASPTPAPEASPLPSVIIDT